MIQNDGGPAFPCELGASGYGPVKSCLTPEGQMAWIDLHHGMALRDWFAGMALQGMKANPSLDWEDDRLAKWAYQQADAMLAARDKPPEQPTP